MLTFFLGEEPAAESRFDKVFPDAKTNMSLDEADFYEDEEEDYYDDDDDDDWDDDDDEY